jgi:hypothetical protein
MNRQDVTEMIITAKRKKGLKWADIAKVAGIAPETRLQLALNLSELIGVTDPRYDLDIIWDAVRQAPNVRDTWGHAPWPGL